jgi:hypothetical protein
LERLITTYVFPTNEDYLGEPIGRSVFFAQFFDCYYWYHGDARLALPSTALCQHTRFILRSIGKTATSPHQSIANGEWGKQNAKWNRWMMA